MAKQKERKRESEALEKEKVPRGNVQRLRQQDERKVGGSGRTVFFLALGSCF